MNFNELFRQPRAQQSLIAAVNVCALLILTASLANWSWLILPSPQLSTSPATASNIPAVARPLDIQPLLLAHLFGQPPANPSEAISTDIQPSSLNLVLTGIIGVKDAGLAIISVNNQPEEPFVVGQTIMGNAVLHAVFADKVTISRNGVMESLVLEEAKTGSPALSLPMLPAAQLSRPMGRPEAVGAAPNQRVVKRDSLLEQIRSSDVLKQSVFVPVPTGGLLVQSGQRGHILEGFGVQEGDVVRSINGQNLKTMDDAMRAYQVLLSSPQIQIEIIRYGVPQSLQYRVE